MLLTREQKQIKEMQRRYEKYDRHLNYLEDDFERLETWLVGLTNKLKVSKGIAKPVPVVVPCKRLIGPQKSAKNKQKRRIK